MAMLPDYPDRVISTHRSRVHTISIVCQMTLVILGALWLFHYLGSGSDPLLGLFPVVVIFSSALLTPDLVEFGPTERTRVSTALCIAWPPMLAFAETYRQSEGNSSALFSLVALSLVLLLFSIHLLSFDVNSKRWRALSTIVGFGLAIPIILTNSNPTSWLVIAVPAIFSSAPLLLLKDGLEGDRRDFLIRLKNLERRLLDINSESGPMQQPISLLKKAREDGMKDPERGLHLISEAENEIQRTMSFLKDLVDIRDSSESTLVRSEGITGSKGGARRIFEDASEEMENGSLRSAENKFREAKTMAEKIVTHWESATKAISEAEEALGSEEGHLVGGLRSSLESARKAMEEEDPEYAISIVSEIPSQMGDVEDLMSRANRSVMEANSAISSSEVSISEENLKRLDEAREAIDSGNASLAIGLAEGVTRSIRNEKEAKSSVQRALRQRKSIEESIPSGQTRSAWMERLEKVESLASNGQWEQAQESINDLTRDLDSFASKGLEARKMLEFLSDDWKNLRKRLDSAGVPPGNPQRKSADGSLSKSEVELDRGNIEKCLELLEEADLAMESLRRFV